MEHAASILGPESHPEGKQLFHGQSYLKRFLVGGGVLECHNSVSSKNCKKFAPYSDSHFVVRFLFNTDTVHLCSIKGRIPGTDLFTSVSMPPDSFSIPKITAISHCQETTIFFSSVGRLWLPERFVLEEIVWGKEKQHYKAGSIFLPTDVGS